MGSVENINYHNTVMQFEDPKCIKPFACSCITGIYFKDIIWDAHRMWTAGGLCRHRILEAM